MSSVLIVLWKVLNTLADTAVGILIWETGIYFCRLPEKDKHKPLLAWNILALLFLWVLLLIKV